MIAYPMLRCELRDIAILLQLLLFGVLIYILPIYTSIHVYASAPNFSHPQNMHNVNSAYTTTTTTFFLCDPPLPPRRAVRNNFTMRIFPSTILKVLNKVVHARVLLHQPPPPPHRARLARIYIYKQISFKKHVLLLQKYVPRHIYWF